MSGNERVAKALGYAGLIPFVVFSIGSWISLPMIDDASSVLIAYAAVILTFIGAVHWGVIMTGTDDGDTAWMTVSVVPSLVAWIVLLLPAHPALVILLVSFIVHTMFDRRMDNRNLLPEWYLPMRKRLTLVVTVCLVSAIFSVGDV